MRLVLALLIAALSLGADRATAETCSTGIARVRSAIAIGLHRVAAEGETGRETPAARRHRQPTPKSLVRAERRVDDDPKAARALAALQRARKADRRGETRRCRAAVAEADRVLLRH